MSKAWLVERDYDSKGLIRLTYATEDGERVHVKEIAEQRLGAGEGPTAAIDVDEANMTEPDDPEEVDRFAREAQRMAAHHAPTDTV